MRHGLLSTYEAFHLRQSFDKDLAFLDWDGQYQEFLLLNSDSCKDLQQVAKWVADACYRRREFS